jgi:hypothetical protein
VRACHSPCVALHPRAAAHCGAYAGPRVHRGLAKLCQAPGRLLCGLYHWSRRYARGWGWGSDGDSKRVQVCICVPRLAGDLVPAATHPIMANCGRPNPAPLPLTQRPVPVRVPPVALTQGATRTRWQVLVPLRTACLGALHPSPGCSPLRPWALKSVWCGQWA